MVAAPVALSALLCALALFAWLGVTARGRDVEVGHELDDYLTARDSQGALTLGMSFFASGLGAWILFTPPEIGAFVGMDGVVGYALAAAAPFAAIAVVGPPLRRALPRGRSLSEFARARFGPGFHLAVTAVSVLYMLTFLAAELTAVGALGERLTGLSGDAVAVLVAAATLAYTTVAGLRASLRTDTWQGWLILALLAAGALAALRGLPDAGDAWGNSGLLGLDRLGVEVALTLLIAVTAANLFHQGYWQRVWAARDDGALRRGGLLGAAFTLPVMLLVGAMGVVAAGTGADLGTPAAPFFTLLSGLGDVVGLLLFLLGVALVASSVDTLQVGLSALWASELPRATLNRARLLTALAMVPVTVVALLGTSVLRIFLVADLLATAAVVPLLAGFWRRATPTGAILGVVAGLVGAVVPHGPSGATFPDGVPTLAPFAWSLAASAATALAASLLTRAGQSSGRGTRSKVPERLPPASSSRIEPT